MDAAYQLAPDMEAAILMGAFDEILHKAEELAVEHKDQVGSLVDKATDLVDDKTGHKYTDKLDSVDHAVEDALAKKAE